MEVPSPVAPLCPAAELKIRQHLFRKDLEIQYDSRMFVICKRIFFGKILRELCLTDSLPKIIKVQNPVNTFVQDPRIQNPQFQLSMVQK